MTQSLTKRKTTPENGPQTKDVRKVKQGGAMLQLRPGQSSVHLLKADRFQDSTRKAK